MELPEAREHLCNGLQELHPRGVKYLTPETHFRFPEHSLSTDHDSHPDTPRCQVHEALSVDFFAMSPSRALLRSNEVHLGELFLPVLVT